MAKLLWTQKQDIGPSVRFNAGMAYDSARQRTVLFGGQAVSGPTNDTWAWDGTPWTQMEDIGPAPRSAHALAYDSVRQRIVLFGGIAGATIFGDTWEWDGTEWTQIADTGPGARQGVALTFDSRIKRVVLFGGSTVQSYTVDTGSFWTGQHYETRYSYFPLNDTWEWDATQ